MNNRDANLYPHPPFCTCVDCCNQRTTRLTSPENHFRLIACGPWLAFSTPQRIALTLRYWLPWLLVACWRSRTLWLKYLSYKVLSTRPMLFCDLNANDSDTDIVPPDLIFRLSLSGKGHWLWYETRKQLQTNRPTTYPVDWSGKGKGWYPFW